MSPLEATGNMPLLAVRDLAVHFPVTRPGGVFRQHVDTVKAVDGVTFSMRRGETLGLVGESGCGKSTTGRAVLQLLRPSAGEVIFDGEPIHSWWVKSGSRWKWDARLRNLRRRMQMIFQDPHASLDPRMTVESLIAEPLGNFGASTASGRRDRVRELMEMVGLDPRFLRRYPHEFSGGQRQRIGIARALALGPEFIVADEPISALDVSIQAQILNLLARLRDELHLTMLFVAHDLAAVRHVSDRIAVMYLGRIVELGPAEAIFERPRHPYTQALLSAIPLLGEQVARPIQLQGDPPSPIDPPAGCAFHTRCPYAEPRCGEVRPVLEAGEVPAHQTACVRQHELDLSATHA